MIIDKKINNQIHTSAANRKRIGANRIRSVRPNSLIDWPEDEDGDDDHDDYDDDNHDSTDQSRSHKPSKLIGWD